MADTRRRILRDITTTLVCASCHGFAIGAGKNLTYAWRSAIKFPLLLLGTGALCAIAWFVLARFLGTRLRFVDVQCSALGLYRSLAIMLASLSPVSLFLGRTMAPPDERSLGGYPAFVVTSMLFVATAGSMALVLQSRQLLHGDGLSRQRAAAVTGAWLVLSLLVGGQLAFWLRPFFGIASLTGDPPFLLGSEPTVTGARNFYEVVWQCLTRADPGDYVRRR